MSRKTQINQIIKTMNRDLKKWLIASEKFKSTGTILYSKIKSSLVLFEAHADREKLNKIQAQMGKNFFLSLSKIFK